MRSVLSVVFWITRLCEPANPPSQCQIVIVAYGETVDLRRLDETGHSVIGLVEPIGIEPMTSSLQS